jgi:hypothetical protein
MSSAYAQLGIDKSPNRCRPPLELQAHLNICASDCAQNPGQNRKLFRFKPIIGLLAERVGFETPLPEAVESSINFDGRLPCPGLPSFEVLYQSSLRISLELDQRQLGTLLYPKGFDCIWRKNTNEDR